MDKYVHFVYTITKKFPKEEVFGSKSQLRRASLSVILNYIEGFARKRIAVQINFYEISYGSLKESAYLVKFAYEEGWILEEEYKILSKDADEIGAMLWKELESFQQRNT